VGEDFPVLVKLNSQDYLDGGMTVQEAVRVASMLEQASVDAIEFSGGTISSPVQYIPPRPGPVPSPDQEVYYREAATLFKQHLSIPLILVGGIRSYTVAEELIANKTADYISLARPLISEPALVKRWKEGDRRKAACVSCNGCFGSGLEGRGISCVVMTAKKAGQQAG
jgi:2,4-dienoyl-CoA reductase-like NADH-dependent reductase (Old Yellow Enzyme family)